MTDWWTRLNDTLDLAPKLEARLLHLQLEIARLNLRISDMEVQITEIKHNCRDCEDDE